MTEAIGGLHGADGFAWVGFAVLVILVAQAVSPGRFACVGSKHARTLRNSASFGNFAPTPARS